MNNFLKIWITFFLYTFYGCTNNKEIHSGDLIFRGNNNSGLSEAINEVTKTQNAKSYSHVGICIIEHDTIWVYHAIPKMGVCKVLLKDFCKPDDKEYYSDIYSITTKQIPLDTIKSIINSHMGEPYDSTYNIESPGMYCSEFIYTVYKPLNIFKLYPMSFKDPKSGITNKIWKEYYNNLGIKIPEGAPGCNPTKMATNKNLIYKFRVHLE